MWLDTFNEMRKQSGMSLDELCEKSGIPKGTLSKITSLDFARSHVLSKKLLTVYSQSAKIVLTKEKEERPWQPKSTSVPWNGSA